MGTAQGAASLVAGVRAGVSSWRDPAARLRRRQRRARWGVGIRAVPTAALSVVAAETIVGGSPVLGGTVAAVAAGGLWVTGVAARRAWRLHRLPVPRRMPPLPRRGSAARPAMQRLVAQQRALDQLVDLLGPSASDTAAEADAAAIALREYSERIVAIEAARPAASGEQRRDVDAAVGALVSRLESGVTAHGRLVAAAADAVAASSGPPDRVALHRVAEETDRLSGLAIGLRELDRGE